MQSRLGSTTIRGTYRCVRTVLALASAGWMATTGCGLDDSRSDPASEPAEAGGKPGGSSCDHEAFDAVDESASFDPAFEVTSYRALSADPDSGLPVDAFFVQAYQADSYGGPTAPGTYSLVGSNYANCGLCVAGWQDCTDSGCGKAFYADEGYVTITALSKPGEPFAAELHRVRLREVTIDSSDYASTPVEAGETWCVDGYAFNETVVEDVAEPVCVAEGTGVGLGDNIANFSLQNCKGEWVDLHSHCGGAKAVWLMLVTGWCSACAQAVPQAGRVLDAYASRGLELMIIMGEDSSYQAPSLEFCERYAQQHQIDPALLYLDSGDTYGSFETTFTHVYPYVGDSIGLPWSALLRGVNMEYVYADTVGDGDLDGAMGRLLSE